MKSCNHKYILNNDPIGIRSSTFTVAGFALHTLNHIVCYQRLSKDSFINQLWARVSQRGNKKVNICRFKHVVETEREAGQSVAVLWAVSVSEIHLHHEAVQ